MLGQKIGSYEIVEEIGRGGMATVYRAYQSSVNRFVAIKVIQQGILLEPTSIERFMREAQLIAQLEHVHILPVYDFDGQHNPPYIVMRYLPSGTLREVMARVILPIGEVVHLFRQIASALDYSHRQNVVHRDIKPSNIMIDAEGNIFLTDFGIARIISAKAVLTASGAAIGTPAYMAPEQGLGQEVDGRADIYSLGVILYELLTGNMPYVADSPLATIYKHIHDPVPNILDDNPDLPISLQAFFEKVLAKHPPERFQTADELVSKFEQASGVDVSTQPVILKKVATQTIRELAEQRENLATTDKDTDTKTVTPSPEESTYHLDTDTAGFSQWDLRRVLSLIAILLVIGVAGFLLFTTFYGDDNQSEDANPTTVDANITPTIEATTAIAILNASDTATVLLPSATVTPTFTFTATNTLSADNAVDTLEAQETSAKILAYTQTATLWSPTSSPTSTITANWTQTIDAERTARAWERATEITWTPTPSDTPTDTATSTATLTATLTPTSSYTSTFTATPSDTPSQTPTITPTFSPVEIAFIPVERNADWQPYSEVIDGVEMVLVPSGSFMMGSNEEEQLLGLELCLAAAQNGATCESSWFDKESPSHVQEFPTPFWIDKTAVTRTMYQVCVDAGECTSTPAPSFPTTDDQPISRITWFQTKEYCDWRDARLPTEVEWEYAARGADGLIFPWGNDFIENFANHCDSHCAEADWARGMYVNQENDDGFEFVSPVRSYPAGVSWIGAWDMSGNVWEWTSTIFMDYPYDANDGRENISDTTSPRILRGGSYVNSTNHLRTSNRINNIPTVEDSGIGFRCARDVTPVSQNTSSPEIETPSPLEVAQAGVVSNSEWEPYSETIDGVEMVLVPAGCFMMGSTDEQIDYAVSLGGSRALMIREQGSHRICFLKPFWIDKTEVTRAMYQECFDVGACQFPSSSSYSSQDNQPINQMSWFEAKQYCEWRKTRLPSESEWEYAARGPDSWVFPWGNEWDSSRVNWSNTSPNETFAVGSYPTGASWVGALDMSGNVWEWTSTIYQDYPYDTRDGREDVDNGISFRVLRGGAFFYPAFTVRAANRYEFNPNYENDYFGFRCARDLN